MLFHTEAVANNNGFYLDPHLRQGYGGTSPQKDEDDNWEWEGGDKRDEAGMTERGGVSGSPTNELLLSRYIGLTTVRSLNQVL